MPALRTALITGSALRVGRAIALHLAGRGWALGLHCRNSCAEAEELARTIRGLGVECRVAPADFAEPAMERAIFAALEGLPPVELLVHNASHFEKDTLTTLTAECFTAHMQANLYAPLTLSREFVGRFKGNAGNIICLLDGMQGWSLSAQFLSYALSKKGLEAAIALLAEELAPKIRINGIALGPTLPGALDKEDTFAKLEWLTPLQRTSDPAEVCRAIDFLLEAPGMTGGLLDLSGGMAIRRAHRP